ncbi:MAG: hypothetical protein K9M07_05155 [Simkaniaceae bacterium]|nr:hypothetical protein [Simkaniaceae bacterium]
MKLTIKIIIVFCFLNSLIASAEEKKCHRVVTYELSKGRFGDQLLCYLHAKWVAFKYNLPILYKPFAYSQYLRLDDLEPRVLKHVNRNCLEKKVLQPCVYLEKFLNTGDKPTLYVIPYFPESNWEMMFYGTRNKWPYFFVDWTNEGFLREIRGLIHPKKPLKLVAVSKDKINVAIHIRQGKEYDGEGISVFYPLKFPPFEFYVEQLKNLHKFFNYVPLYVNVFTDDSNHSSLVAAFQREFNGHQIQFESSKSDIQNQLGVLEDFFSMLQFDCLIYSESNFSRCASIIGDYMLSIRPKAFHWKGGDLVIDDVDVKIGKKFFKSSCYEEIYTKDFLGHYITCFFSSR